jgi:hypothetical protein
VPYRILVDAIESPTSISTQSSEVNFNLEYPPIAVVTSYSVSSRILLVPPEGALVNLSVKSGPGSLNSRAPAEAII